ncbi:MAG: tRNA guanosine(34) transglycosylase Tgt [Candidatus Nealsonbacteria bacterium]|nr:tRNA guanosine(34) transglycosylase Tgt [Candidatus Nealsonbacteria bacterium]
MIKFEVLKKSKLSKARIGSLKTKHGAIGTPCLVAVATQAVVKTLTSEEVKAAKSQILISNTFHLHLKPGEDVVKKSGGLHKFMNWDGPLMTDSGGYQVFSLGFGKDLNIGKIVKNPGSGEIKEFQQPKSVKITEDGVYFSSPVDGKKLFLGPEESIRIQEKLGADIIFAFDECTPSSATRKYVERSLEKTHKWAKKCLESKKSDQALFGIVQGSEFKDLRQKSASFLNAMDFEGFGIGGDLGKDRKATKEILKWTVPLLDEKKPRHLLGIGYLENMEDIIKEGIDLFDCTVPTHFARHGIAFNNSGRMDMRQTKFLKDKNPIDKKCSCFVCKSYKRNYISHLLRAKEITALKLLTFHNLYFFNSFVEDIKRRIKSNKI